MPRAVVWGRTLAPAALRSLTQLEHAPVEVVAAVAVGQAEGQRPARRPSVISASRSISARVLRCSRRCRARPGGARPRTRPAGGGPGPRRWPAARRRRPRCRGPAARRAPGAAACARSRSRARRRRWPRRPGAHMRSMSSARGRLLAQAALAHGVDPHRAVADHAADVDALGPALDRVEVLAVARPVPGQALHDRSRPGCPRPTPSSRPAPRGRRACTGAKVTPQLPSTTEVTPCQHDDEPIGSHASWASRWVWMSTKPGVTTQPSASMMRRPSPTSATAPTATTRSPSTATSAAHGRGPGAVDHGAVGDHQIVHVVPPARSAGHSAD